ncbi:unnamed protein product [Sympodiomycopsis kandeliae]
MRRLSHDDLEITTEDQPNEAAESYKYWSQLRSGIATAAALRSAQVERETRRRNRRHASNAFQGYHVDHDDMGEFLQDSGKKRFSRKSQTPDPDGSTPSTRKKRNSSSHDDQWQPLAHLFGSQRQRRGTQAVLSAESVVSQMSSETAQSTQANAQDPNLPTVPQQQNVLEAPAVAEEPESWLDSDRDRVPLGQDPLALSNDKDLLDSDTDSSSDSEDDQERKSTKPPPSQSGFSTAGEITQLSQVIVSLMSSLPILSPLTKGILKCVVAYFIASLFTYSYPLSNFMAHLLPNHDPDALVPFGSLHMIATIAVYFHPARSFGSMVEADIYAIGAFMYTAFLGLTSMLVAEYLHDQNRPYLSNVVTVVMFIALGTGLVGYVKVKMNKPTFNTACSLIFVSTFTVIVKEGATHLGKFETDAIWQVMIVVIAGTLIANFVSFTLWPSSATTNLNNDITRLLDAYSTLLRLLTRTFLLDSPSTIHIRSSRVHSAISAHHSAYTSLQKNLAEAKFETLFDPRIKGLIPSVTDMVSCLHRLGQHLGGLRNSCGLQSDLLFGGDARKRTDYTDNPQNDSAKARDGDKNALPGDALPEEFRSFLDAIGPHIRSLVFICSRALHELETLSRKRTEDRRIDDTIAVFDELQSDVAEALKRFKHEQTVALKTYNNHTLEPQQSESEVSLGSTARQESTESRSTSSSSSREGEAILIVFFFIFNLEEFALELRHLIKNMREIHLVSSERRAMTWYQWLSGQNTRGTSGRRSSRIAGGLSQLFSLKSFTSNSPANTLDFPSVSRHAPNTAQTPRVVTMQQKFCHLLWRIGEFFRQRDVKFAIKAGVGCAILASPAFIYSTRDTFREYKGEWALISFMVVLSPTVGQSNQMSLHRVLGTIAGAIVAVVAYLLFPDNNVVLPIIGAIFSIPCFWYIVGKPSLASTGRFVLLTFNLTALYAYNVRKTGVEAEQVGFQRTVAVTIGVLWATMLNHLLWPNEARRELTVGLSDLLFKMSWLYQCLAIRSQQTVTRQEAVPIQAGSENTSILESQPLLPSQPSMQEATSPHSSPGSSSYQTMELHLQFQLIRLESLLAQTTNEPRLKGPFPVATYRKMIVTCTGVLDQLHSLRGIVERKEWKLIADEKSIWSGLVVKWRREMVGNILLFFHILASSLNLKTPLPPYLPPAESSRRSLVSSMNDLPMVKNQAWRGGQTQTHTSDKAYLLIWSYCLCNREIIRGLQELGSTCKEAFGVVGGMREFEGDDDARI